MFLNSLKTCMRHGEVVRHCAKWKQKLKVWGLAFAQLSWRLLVSPACESFMPFWITAQGETCRKPPLTSTSCCHWPADPPPGTEAAGGLEASPWPILRGLFLLPLSVAGRLPVKATGCAAREERASTREPHLRHCACLALDHLWELCLAQTGVSL